MSECSFCGRTDGTHAPGCYGGWTRDNAPPTYDELAARNNDLRLEVQELRRQLAECRATMANSGNMTVAQVADAEDYPPTK